MSKRYLVSQRDVILIPFPFSDLSQAKFRPAIVMSNNRYNKKFHDFIAIPLTSNPNTRKHTVVVTNKEMETGNIPIDSVAKADKVFSLEQKLITRTFGQLRQDVFDSVSTEIIKLIRWLQDIQTKSSNKPKCDKIDRVLTKGKNAVMRRFQSVFGIKSRIRFFKPPMFW